MDKKQINSYQPIPLPFKKKLSDKSMKLKSDNFLLKIYKNTVLFENPS